MKLIYTKINLSMIANLACFGRVLRVNGARITEILRLI